MPPLINSIHLGKFLYPVNDDCLFTEHESICKIIYDIFKGNSMSNESLELIFVELSKQNQTQQS